MTELVSVVIPPEILARITGREERTDGEGRYRMTRYRATFDNGYVLSFIRGEHSYGGHAGLWEVALMYDDGDTYEWAGQDVFPDVFVADDVAGWQTVEQVIALMARICDLPRWNRPALDSGGNKIIEI